MAPTEASKKLYFTCMQETRIFFWFSILEMNFWQWIIHMEISASTEATRPYVQICPSVLRQIKASNPADCPSTFYKKAISTSQCHSTLSPFWILRTLSKWQTTKQLNAKDLEFQWWFIQHTWNAPIYCLCMWTLCRSSVYYFIYLSILWNFKIEDYTHR